MLQRFLLFVLMLATLSVGCREDAQPQPDPPADADVAVEPGDAGPGDTADTDPRGVVNIRTNQVRTRHIFNGSVTSAKLGLKSVTVTVTAASAAVTTSADTDLAGGLLLGCHPSTNQDQFIDNIVLNANGSITLTLAANATANNVFSCKVLKPNVKGVS